MKQLTLSLIVVLIVLGVLGIANAAISGVAFVTPVTGDNISGSSYVINWTNTIGHPGLYLQERSGGCASSNPWVTLMGPFNEGTKTYSWDTSSKAGVYCLRLYNLDNETITGNFTIDNTDPVASLAAGEPYLCNEGDVINLDASNSFDNETGIASYEWDDDNDGSYDDGTGVTHAYTCPDGPAVKTVRLRVKDYAGNSDETSSTVNVSNVAPVCNGIVSYTDFAVGEPTTLWENASDVVDSLEYTWDFDDGSSDYIGNPANHTFASADVYNVTVTVYDGTESCMDSVEITVVDPILLTAQEVMALANLNANFTPNAGVAANSFATGLATAGDVNCAKRITEPAGMTITGNGSDCMVAWNAVPNSYSGINPMVVRVDNGTDYEYYTFDTTVWSWKINLTPGWNLFSIPVVPEDSSIDAVVFDQLENSLAGGSEYVIWCYKYDSSISSNRWYKSRKDKSGSSDLTSIEPGKAYWINLTNADTLTGYGDKLIAADSPPETIIIAGWNLIGHYGLLNTVTLNNALKSIDGFWNNVLDKDGSVVNGGDTVNPGEGYWLSTKNLFIGEEMIYTPSNESYAFT